ncbi:metal-dependent transcriptional regulator [Actinotalea sp. M2MS4P-6]|uniref:metal-dependent transcriptional regulator n=1 Tax=Actinotalea sp. M2MS4P-6 TaxID=2983762 RepID=UPI0021E433B4|nr:metal-dependent transcriptional regulator [Actinotalea sp. M2MS4P-6]MCV2393836.1 metal-dependent transcriptional regulator [Actinotalea sp. M2MS4P-6]
MTDQDRPTPTGEDYLKAVWRAQEWSDDPVTPSELAAALGAARSTASETIRRLAAQGLLTHPSYGTVALTDEGRRRAVDVVRRHRLVEAFLVQALGYSWDEVHQDAEVIEHAVSDRFVERVDAALGHPARDPHGDPIPAPDGTVERPAATRLDQAPIGVPLRVVRVADDDPDLLRHLVELGLQLDATFSVVEHQAYAGLVLLDVDGATQRLGLSATRSIWVGTA